jgi:hypothetical protein
LLSKAIIYPLAFWLEILKFPLNVLLPENLIEPLLLPRVDTEIVLPTMFFSMLVWPDPDTFIKNSVLEPVIDGRAFASVNIPVPAWSIPNCDAVGVIIASKELLLVPSTAILYAELLFIGTSGILTVRDALPNASDAKLLKLMLRVPTF